VHFDDFFATAALPPHFGAHQKRAVVKVFLVRVFDYFLLFHVCVVNFDFGCFGHKFIPQPLLYPQTKGYLKTTYSPIFAFFNNY